MEWKCYLAIALFALLASTLTFLVYKRHCGNKKTVSFKERGRVQEPLLPKSGVAVAPTATTLP